jgi:sulfite reductase (NADPH) flavoprotein alpha-component
LGDSSYPLFCKAGEDVDAHLQELGATQILSLEKSDLDFYPVSDAWINNVVNNLPTAANALLPKPQQKHGKNGKHFYKGTVRTHINLNDKGSSKETWHIEIATNESIYYLPGDSLGIVPPNADEDVNEIISLLHANKNQTIEYKNETFTLFDLFKFKLNILYLPLRIVEKYGKLIQSELPSVRLDLKNILSLYPSNNVSLEDFIHILEPITPRLYSVSSSPYAHGNNEIHITVGRNKFWVNDKAKYGFCSSHFAGLNEGDEVTFYINTNDNFRLPQQGDKDVIMIGPGTGIAPFRSFISHRDDEGAPGRNWLFFGDQHFHSDFLYQTELLSFFDTGLLTRLNTAFSRDQKEKVYVQHRLQQQSKELFSWIEGGAYIYICGCKNTMAKDVEETLINIISDEGNLDRIEAEDYLNRLEEEGRYSKDVY